NGMRVLEILRLVPEAVRRPPRVTWTKEQNRDRGGIGAGLALDREMREFGQSSSGAGTKRMGKDQQFRAAGGTSDVGPLRPSQGNGFGGSGGLIESDQSPHPGERGKRREA